MNEKKKTVQRQFNVSLLRKSTGSSLTVTYHAVSSTHAILLAKQEFPGWEATAA